MANTKVTTGVIKDDAVGADQLASNSVVTASIVDNAITTAKINNDAILTAKISNSAVTNAKLAANSVDSDQYVDGSIDTAHIADGQITSAKLDTNISVSGTLTVGSHLSLGDSDEIRIGDSSDLKIYHDGSNSYIDDTGTGNLLVRAGNLQFQRADGTQIYLLANTGAEVAMYYAGAKKFETTSSGVDVTGTVTADNAIFGTTSDAATIVYITSSTTGESELRLGDTDTDAGSISYTNSNDTLTFRAAAANRMSLDSTGLGIGTSSPNHALHIQSTDPALILAQSGSINNANSGRILFAESPSYTTTNSHFEIKYDGLENHLYFGSPIDGSTDLFVVGRDGAVGIGTSSPAELLHLSSAEPVLRFTDSDDGNYHHIFSSSNDFYISADRNDSGSGNLIFRNGATSERMRIGSDGKVYFGNQNNAASSGYIDKQTSGDYELKIHASTSTSTDRAITFHNRSNTEAMRIDSNGLLMVGTTATNTHESSGAGNEGVVIRPAAFSTWSVSNEICQILNRKTTNGVIMQFNYNGSSVGTISTNANSLPSDRNFKRDIEDLNIGLDLVTKLNPVSYNYKIDGEDTPKMYGLIAQDLEESLEEVGVDKNSVQLLQHKPNDDEKESDYSLDYLKLTPILIKAIQEQQEQIEALKQEIQELKE